MTGSVPLSSALVSLLADWLPGNAQPDRPQLILSTICATGGVDARTVLLSEYDDNGFYFHTDSRSRKVADLATDPAVALTFLWPGFTRQLVVQGIAEVASDEEIAAAFRARSPYLKQLAWQNSLEFAQLPIEQRRTAWADFTTDPDSLPQPATWIGFLVRPTRLTFWTSNADAPARREEHTLVDAEWVVTYLAG